MEVRREFVFYGGHSRPWLPVRVPVLVCCFLCHGVRTLYLCLCFFKVCWFFFFFFCCVYVLCHRFEFLLISVSSLCAFVPEFLVSWILPDFFFFFFLRLRRYCLICLPVCTAFAVLTSSCMEKPGGLCVSLFYIIIILWINTELKLYSACRVCT